MLGEQRAWSTGGWNDHGPRHTSGRGWADQRGGHRVRREQPYLCRDHGGWRQVLGERFLWPPGGRYDEGLQQHASGM